MLPDIHTNIGSLFLDSGAYGIYNEHARGRTGVQGHNLRKGSDAEDTKYAFFKTKEFFAYLDRYADYCKEHGKALDVCVNVDAIYNPELSFDNLRYLQDKGIKPIPVIHCHTPMKWVEKYLSSGFDYIGFGGLGHGTNFNEYARWADQAFRRVCDGPGKKPIVRVHGFAMTSWRSIFRYPWWSVDSSSWVKMAAYGGVFFPRKQNGKFSGDKMCGMVRFTHGCAVAGHLHYLDLSPMERNTLLEWFEMCGIPLGSFDPDGKELVAGVATNWVLRAKANLLFFEFMRNNQQPWPWSFSIRDKANLFGAFDTYDSSKFDRHTYEPTQLRIYYAGCGSIKDAPEALIPERNPNVLLNFFDIDRDVGKARERVTLHEQNLSNKKQAKHSKKNANR